MKAILISIKPKWVAKILNGEKTIEVRKTAPKCDLPIEVYVYCTRTIKPLSDYDWGEFTFDDLPKLGKVVAKFTLDEIYEYQIEDKNTWKDKGFGETTQKMMGMGLDELHAYVGDKTFYGWHISDLEIFDKPRKLHNRKQPPRTWCYLKERK